MLEMREHGQTIAELADVFKRSSPEHLQQRLLAHLNGTGLLLLEDPFPRQRKFYGWIICRPNNRVGDKEVYEFIGRQKGRPHRPGFIITTTGFTPTARDVAQRWDIELITFSKWADYLLSGKMRNAETGERYDIDFLA